MCPSPCRIHRQINNLYLKLCLPNDKRIHQSIPASIFTKSFHSQKNGTAQTDWAHLKAFEYCINHTIEFELTRLFYIQSTKIPPAHVLFKSLLSLKDSFLLALTTSSCHYHNLLSGAFASGQRQFPHCSELVPFLCVFISSSTTYDSKESKRTYPELFYSDCYKYKKEHDSPIGMIWGYFLRDELQILLSLSRNNLFHVALFVLALH